MPFEQGAVSFRMFALPRALPADAVARFAAAAAPPIDASIHSEVRGWVTGRHLLDRDINEQTAYYGGHLRLTLLQAERKVPPTLLRAECRMEELAHLAATGASFLSRREKSEIKRQVEERLLPTMPPQLKGIPFIHSAASGVVYATATSVKQMDAFTTFLNQTLGIHIDPCLPGMVAMDRHAVDVEEWQPSSFSPELDDRLSASTAGREFLTWLWFNGETHGSLDTGDTGEIGILVEGPLTFVLEGNGAHETMLRKGEPLQSAEAKTCLLAGKTLRSSKLSLTRGDEVYACSLDADEFLFRGLKLPEVDAVDAVTRFQERMIKLDAFREIFLALYDRFVEERRASARWKKTRAAIHQWVAQRPTRN